MLQGSAEATVTVADAVVTHPFPPVTVTVYTVVVVGETIIEAEVAPVLHKNVKGASPPVMVAVTVAEPCGQIVGEFSDSSGAMPSGPPIKSFNSAVKECDALVVRRKEEKQISFPTMAAILIPPSKKAPLGNIPAGPNLGTYGHGDCVGL